MTLILQRRKVKMKSQQDGIHVSVTANAVNRLNEESDAEVVVLACVWKLVYHTTIQEIGSVTCVSGDRGQYKSEVPKYETTTIDIKRVSL